VQVQGAGGRELITGRATRAGVAPQPSGSGAPARWGLTKPAGMT